MTTNVVGNGTESESEVTATETESEDTTTDAYDTVADEDSKDESEEDNNNDTEEYYKMVKNHENAYSYAYKDALSPAALIQLENASVVSEVSEGVYESLGFVSESSKMETMSEMSERGEDMFFSISKGRRNYLQLHKYVDWDLNSVAEEDPSHGVEEKPKNVKHKTSEANKADHSRLLPLILHDEVGCENCIQNLVYAVHSFLFQEDKNLRQSQRVPTYYKYAQYKNIRSSKVSPEILLYIYYWLDICSNNSHDKLNHLN